MQILPLGRWRRVGLIFGPLCYCSLILTIMSRYVDWNNYNTATSEHIRVNWAIATILSSTIMAIAMCYIVTEWCLQSHLSTADMTSASRGLFLTRRFRWLTSPFRDFMHYMIEMCYAMRLLVSKVLSTEASPTPQPRQNRRSVRWTKRSFSHEPQPNPPTSDIPLSDLSTGRPRVGSDAPLIQDRDVSASPPTPADTRPFPPGSLHSPRASTDEHTLPDAEIESPSRLHVPENRPGFMRQASERSFSV